jgi:hypothetical protein
MSGNELAGVGKLWRAGKPEEAKSLALSLLAKQPENPEFWDVLGLIQAFSGNPQEAANSFFQAVRFAPANGDFQAHLGNALGEQGRHAEAEAAFRQAIALGGQGPDTLRGLANVLVAQYRVAEALEFRRQAVELAPGRYDFLFDWADSLAKAGRLEEGLTVCRRALAIAPDFFPAKRLLWILLLLTGDLAGGFAAYEARLEEAAVPLGDIFVPLWQGDFKPGSRLLVHSEQGLGDAIQMFRYIPLLAERGIRVTLQCQPSLIEICNNLEGVESVLPWGASVPSVDAWVPLMSLPQRFKTTLATLPASIPYLAPNPARIAAWRTRLGEGFKIGLVWQGNPLHGNDALRSFPLALLAPVLRLPGYHFFGLQKDHGREQMADWPIIDLGPEVSNIGETAAALSVLDLVISCDTSIAHLSGALGRPTWLYLPPIPDWRWLMKREDSPWYPSLRLFRQSDYGDRDEPFVRMAAELRK